MFQNLIPIKRTLATLCVLLVSLCFLTTSAFAQLDYDTYDIVQGGVIVGVIYVPQRGADTSVYSEYWVMSNHYVYPSQTNPVVTSIVQATGYHYTSLTDFLTKVPWGDGFHFVTVTAYDRTTLPVPAVTTVN